MPDEQKYWLWVTSREIAEKSNLAEHKHVTWTCDKNTKAGDLILLYLNSKGEPVKKYHKSAFCFLIQAIMDARDYGKEFRHWPEQGWSDGCYCQVLKEFKDPVRFRDLKERDSELKEWDAYKKRNFQGTSFKIPRDIWNLLDEMAVDKNPEYHGYQELL